ncbi:hypothetical protein B0J14DRAFT_272412 [Halenospora varia]|nr:hypothetical protein B0J14DRAFT_272412 [Halenospora varia]
MQGIVAGEEILPSVKVSTDAQIMDWARQHVQTVYHASCTCKMGKLSDPMAVTDSGARAIGANNLRVVDTSHFRYYHLDIRKAQSMHWQKILHTISYSTHEHIFFQGSWSPYFAIEK